MERVENFLAESLKYNPSWIGILYEKYIDSEIKRYDALNPPEMKSNGSPESVRTEEYSCCPFHNDSKPKYDMTDVSDIYVNYNKSVFINRGVKENPLEEDKHYFCTSFWNGWGVEIKSKWVCELTKTDKGEVEKKVSNIRLPIPPKEGWVKTNKAEYKMKGVERRWSDLYIFISYSTNEGVPDFTGVASIMVVPTFLIKRYLGNIQQSVKVSSLEKKLGKDLNKFKVTKIEEIPQKIIELITEYWIQMLKYKIQGDVKKKKWHKEHIVKK
ncbi:hypothetical protein GNP67_19190 [Aliivibrio fischeri]|nr:hypothetical protein [Aliivibrio fischeri]